MTENLNSVLSRVKQTLAAAGIENPGLDARILVRYGGQFSDGDMIIGGQSPLSAELIEKIEEFAKRRAAGEPVSRLLGEREFWGLSFEVSPDTLDPRPDTETLVEAALKRAIAMGPRPLRILDLGTGTGCILISLLKELPLATGVGIDLNPGAVDVAKRNAAHHGLEKRADFRLSSWFEGVGADESFDLILSNPPYIPEGDIESLAPEVRKHDPLMALTPGQTGFEAYKILLNDMKKHLVCGGRALFEIGLGQEKELARLAAESMMALEESYVDMTDRVRVLELSCGEK